jgi:hypothetical protein
MLLDQNLIREEDTCALMIQRAFKGWRSRRASNLLLENHSQARNQAVIHLQRLARGRKSRVLASAYRTKTAQISRNVTAIVLEAIQRSSKARVDQLLASQSSTTSLSSSMQRIAHRTKVAQREAASLASNPLPTYAINVLKQLETPNDPPTKFQRMNQIKPRRVETSASSQAQFEAKRPSTPVRCNKTHTVKKAVQHNAFSNKKDVKKKTFDVESARQTVDNSQSAHLKPGISSLDFRKVHRETMKKAPKVKSSVKRSTMKLPKTNATLVMSTPVPKSPPKRAVKNTLFGDPNNMPSPIKKENDWDWEDEWLD